MQLTKFEAAVLQRLRQYRTGAPTLGERLRTIWAWIAVLLLLCVAAAVVPGRPDIPGIAFLPAGIFLGALSRDISAQWRFVKAWPLNSAIMDWTRVDQLLEEAKTATRPEPVSKTRVKGAVGLGLGVFAVLFGAMVAMDQALAYAYNPTRHNPPNSVLVLTASWCPYCESLRRHLLDQHIPYTELDVDHTTEGRFAFTAVRGHGIPITIVGEHIIRGLGKTAKWEKIDAALVQAGYPLTPDTPPAAAATGAQLSPR